jgi:hypothetical protein
MNKLLTSVAISAFLMAGAAHAASDDIFISTQSGQVGEVNALTGTLVAPIINTGEALTDIGFVGNQLFGTTFTNLFSINQSTGAATSIGTYSDESVMNALLGSGTQLLGAAFDNGNIFNINPANAATSAFKTSPLQSAGDLAFSGSTLYESGINRDDNDALVNLTTRTVIGDFTLNGTPLIAVFGLADNGTTMFAVNNQDIFSVNLSNGDLTMLSSFAATGLGDASGTAFIAENAGVVPEPATWGMIVLGFGGMALLAARRKRTVVLA